MANGRKIIWGAGLAALVLIFPVLAAAEIYGYVEGRYLRVTGAGPAVPEYVTSERVRPTFVEPLKNAKGVTITATSVFFLTQYENADPQIQTTADYLVVDRLFADLEAGPARVRVGRQAVNWGSALIWNPTDPFPEVFLTDYWAERKGLNALRVYFPLPQNSRLTMVATTGDSNFTENRYAIKASVARWAADLSAIWIDDTIRDRLVWGLDVKGTAVIGYWIEAAAFRSKGPIGEPFEQAVIGMDYSFPVKSMLYLAAQYYYDGSGQDRPANYDWTALAAGQRTTLARHYASLTAMLSWNADLTFAVNYIYNLDDATALLTPYLTVVLRDFRVSAGANLLVGPEGGEFRPQKNQDPLNLIPDAVYYMWGRWYF